MRDFNEMRQWLIEKTEETSCRNVGRMLGINHSTIGKLCRGDITSPRLDTLEKINEAMGEEKPSKIEDVDTSENQMEMDGKEVVIITLDDIEETITFSTNTENIEHILTMATMLLCDTAMKTGLSSRQISKSVRSIYKKMLKAEGVVSDNK